ncbi:hypothetical protein MBLNU459_g4311t1 [Dothideomycetes sp. NU459]
MDDWFAVISGFLGLGFWICFVGESHSALGRHAETITAEDGIMLNRWMFFQGIFCIIGMMTVKVAVSLYLLRLTVPKYYRMFLYIIGGIMIAFTFACVFLYIFNCRPAAEHWNLTVGNNCVTAQTWNPIIMSNSIYSLFTDAVIAGIPIPIILKLHFDRRTKIGIFFVCSLGFCAFVCGIFKTYYQFSLMHNSIPDPLYKDYVFTWASLELNIGIIAASLPTLKPLGSPCLELLKSVFYMTRKVRKNSSTESLRGVHMSFAEKCDEDSGDGLTTLSATYSPNGKEKDSFFWSEKEHAASFDELRTVCSRYDADPPTGRRQSFLGRKKSLPTPNLGDGQILVTTQVSKMILAKPRNLSLPNNSISAKYLCPDLPDPRFSRDQIVPHVVGGKKVINSMWSNSSEIELPGSDLLSRPLSESRSQYNTFCDNSSDIELPNSFGLLDDDSSDKPK